LDSKSPQNILQTPPKFEKIQINPNPQKIHHLRPLPNPNSLKNPALLKKTFLNVHALGLLIKKSH